MRTQNFAIQILILTINLCLHSITQCKYHGKVLSDSILVLVPSMMEFYQCEENLL